MSDSAELAVKLEELYPEPSLRLDAELEQEVTGALAAALTPWVPKYLMMRLWRDVIAEEDVDWFHEDHIRRYKVGLEKLPRDLEGRAIGKARQGLDELLGLLKKYRKDDDGPFLLGSEVCYADFILVAALHSFNIIGRLERVLGQRKEWRELYAACRGWLEKKD